MTLLSPEDKGTYILVLSLLQGATLSVGKLGTFRFPPGEYFYVGSAFGPGGLRGRLSHHLRPVANPHWHIDFLREVARLDEIWVWKHPQPQEHPVAASLGEMESLSVPAPRFGATDCRCPAHLFHTRESATVPTVKHSLAAGIPGKLERIISKDWERWTITGSSRMR